MSELKLKVRCIPMGNKPTRITKDLGNGCRMITISPTSVGNLKVIRLNGV